MHLACECRLQVKCSMFSRKWAPSTRDLVYEALTNVTHPAAVLAPRHAEQRMREAAEAAQQGLRSAAAKGVLPRWLPVLPCRVTGGCGRRR